MAVEVEAEDESSVAPVVNKSCIPYDADWMGVLVWVRYKDVNSVVQWKVAKDGCSKVLVEA